MVKRYDLFFDGASRGNPGAAACAFQAFSETHLEKEESFFLGYDVTNNVAEYNGFVACAEWLNQNANRDDSEVFIYSDSELVVKQVNGTYKVKDPKLSSLRDTAISLLKGFTWSIQHISRAENALADKLCNQELNKVRLETESTGDDTVYLSRKDIQSLLAKMYNVMEELEELLR